MFRMPEGFLNVLSTLQQPDPSFYYLIFQENIRHQKNSLVFLPKFTRDQFKEKKNLKISTVSMEIIFETFCSLGNRRKVEVELQATFMIHVIPYFYRHELKKQYHGEFAQNFYKWRKCSLNLWNNNLNKTLTK